MTNVARRVESAQSATAVAGTATVQFNGPSDSYIDIDSISISTTIRTPRPECTVYRGNVNPGALLATVRAGDRGGFTGQNDRIYPSDQILVQWTGCGAGCVCTATLRGSIP